MTIETARTLIPAGSHQEMEKLLQLDLNRESLIVVIGSYKGLTVQILSEAYGSRMMCYDPQEQMCEQLRDLHLDNVEVFAFGLGKAEGIFPMWEIGNDACSFYPGNSQRDPGEGQMKEVSSALDSLNIDFMFLNCEGSEFNILERLYETDLIQNVKVMMVQFHTAVSKGNGNNYDKWLTRLKEDYAVVWTIGAPWTLLARLDNVEPSGERPTPSPGMDVEVGKVEEYERLVADGLSDSEARGTVWPEEPGCQEPGCGFKPDPEKNYGLSMAGHKRSHDSE